RRRLRRGGRGRHDHRPAAAGERRERGRARLRGPPRLAARPGRPGGPPPRRGIHAFIDLYGPEYVDLAVQLDVPPAKIETIIANEKAQEVGAKAEGSSDASTPEILGEVAELVAAGRIEVPIAATSPLDEVREAFEQLEERHTLGKIVLVP